MTNKTKRKKIDKNETTEDTRKGERQSEILELKKHFHKWNSKLWVNSVNYTFAHGGYTYGALGSTICHGSIYAFIDFQTSEHWKTHTLSPAIEYIRVRHTDVSQNVCWQRELIHIRIGDIFLCFFLSFVTSSLLLLLPLLHVVAAVVFGSEFNH